MKDVCERRASHIIEQMIDTIKYTEENSVLIITLRATIYQSNLQNY
jgi:hypothetical protein